MVGLKPVVGLRVKVKMTINVATFANVAMGLGTGMQTGRFRRALETTLGPMSYPRTVSVALVRLSATSVFASHDANIHVFAILPSFKV